MAVPANALRLGPRLRHDFSEMVHLVTAEAHTVLAVLPAARTASMQHRPHLNLLGILDERLQPLLGSELLRISGSNLSIAKEDDVDPAIQRES